MLRIGLDLDQTIADFYGEYFKRFGSPKKSTEITKNVERILKKDKNFWLSLPVLRRPDFIPTLYCTARVNPKVWTKQYLDKQGFPKAPVYQVPGYFADKASRIKGRVDVFIDDSIHNFEKLNKLGIPCLLMDSPYNRDYNTEYRVYSLKLSEIEKVYNNYEKSNY